MFNAKKQYFNAMLKDSEKVIWDLQFKKFTALNERESVRRQYDQLSDALSRITAQLTPIEGETMDEKHKENLEAQKAEVEKNIKDTKTYMDSIDATIVGGAPSSNLPDGAEGIDNKLRSWIQRRDYIKSFIKHNT